MRRGQGERLPVPTLQELNEAMTTGLQIVACSGLRSGPLIALKLGCHNGGIATVYLDVIGRHYLLEALKVLVPRADQSPPASPVIRRETPDGIEIQVGYMSA
jgi:hypothetical protein